MKRQSFTLVELLLVIVVIAILAGIAFPVIGGMNRKGKETRARSEINAIKLAFQQFESDYGAFPQITNTKNNVKENLDDILSANSKGVLKLNTKLNNSVGNEKADLVYDEFMQILNMTVARDDTVASAEKGDAYTAATNPNTKRKRYLDPPAKLVKDSNGKEGYFFLDPWNRRYNIALDWNYDGKVENENNTDPGPFGGETEDLMGKIFIFSYGEAKKGAKDYITSWKTGK